MYVHPTRIAGCIAAAANPQVMTLDNLSKVKSKAHARIRMFENGGAEEIGSRHRRIQQGRRQ